MAVFGLFEVYLFMKNQLISFPLDAEYTKIDIIPFNLPDFVAETGLF